MAPSRKRKRLEASPEQELEEESVYANGVHNSAQNAKHDPEKEQEVWDSFKDEHFEAIDQVPLTLHRQYALIHELDQQSNACLAHLAPTTLQYIEKRRKQANSAIQTEKFPEAQDKNSGHGLNTSEVTERDASQSMPALPGLPSNLSKPATTTRQLLTKLACLADELLRTSEEKVNVAQAAYESLDRHIRIIQQAIKDQETSIIHGARPGHLQPGSLNQLTVGRWVKPTRATLSPINGDDPDGDQDGVQEYGGDPLEALKGLRISTGRGRAKSSRQTSVDVDGVSDLPLTITLPAHPQLATEEVYCTCKGPSYGEMIACDSKKCEIEWFHLECVGLDEVPPEGMKTWYCPQCSRTGSSRGKSRLRK